MLQATKDQIIEELRVHRDRICTCLSLMDDADVWRDVNAHVVSIGNTVLHLVGNLSQQVLAGLGGQDYKRERSAEFTDKPDADGAELQRRLTETVDKAMAVIADMDADMMTRTYTIQGSETTGIGAVIHVVTHFTYHAGQIAFAVKAAKDIDVGFYKGVDLEKD